MNDTEKKQRAFLLTQARLILERCDAEGRDITKEEEREWNDLHEKASRIARGFDPDGPTLPAELRYDGLPEADPNTPLAIPGMRTRGGAPRTEGRIIGQDEQGRDVRAFAPNERLSDGLRFDLPDGIRRDELDLGRYVRALVSGDWARAQAEYRVAQHEKRAMSVGDPASAGWLVPEIISSSIIDYARNRTCVFKAGAMTIPMTSKNLHLAKITGVHTPYWVHENAAFTDSAMSLGTVSLQTKKQGVLVKVSIEAFEDAQNLSSIISDAIAADMAQGLDCAALYGTGAEHEPLGLKNTDGIEVQDVSNSAITDYSEFSQAYFTLLGNNAPEDGLSLIMSPTVGGYLDLLTDTNDGQPLKPPESWSKIKRFMTNQVSSATGTGSANTEAFLGHWNQMLIGVRTSLDLEVSKVAGNALEYGQVWIRAYWRGDVAVTRPDWFCHIQDIAAPGE